MAIRFDTARGIESTIYRCVGRLSISVIAAVRPVGYTVQWNGFAFRMFAENVNCWDWGC